MDLIVWAVLGSTLTWVSEWFLQRVSGPDRSYSRWSWQRVALRVGSLVLAGGLTWWLLDIGGQLRLIAALRSGDKAAIAEVQPHPLIQPDATWVVILLVALCLALGLDMILRPQHRALMLVRDGNVSDSMLRRVKVYGWIIAGLGVLMAAGFGATLLTGQ